MGKIRTRLLPALVLLTVFGFSNLQKSNAQELHADEQSPSGSSFNDFQLETIVVTADAIDDEKQEIESGELRLRKVVDLAEILSDELIEVQMIRKSAYGNEVSVRGFGQENIKVLLDGGILEGACGSRKDPSLSHINILTVKKLTVQEGPFDVTKPGCLGGYIDVITKKPEQGFQGELLGKIGSYGFHSGGFTTTGGSENIQWLFGYNFSESDQYEDGSGERLWRVREGWLLPITKRDVRRRRFRNTTSGVNFSSCRVRIIPFCWSMPMEMRMTFLLPGSYSIPKKNLPI